MKIAFYLRLIDWLGMNHHPPEGVYTSVLSLEIPDTAYLLSQLEPITMFVLILPDDFGGVDSFICKFLKLTGAIQHLSMCFLRICTSFLITWMLKFFTHFLMSWGACEHVLCCACACVFVSVWVWVRYACPWMDRWNTGADVCCLPQLFLFLETGCLAEPGDHCIACSTGCLGSPWNQYIFAYQHWDYRCVAVPGLDMGS